jgi:hypothetical protein
MTSKEALVGASFESQGCDSTAKATGKARKREWATCADPIFLYYWPAARRYAAALPADALTPLAYSGSRRRCEGSAFVAKPGKAVTRRIPLGTALQDAASGTKGFGTPSQPFRSAVASGIPRDTALRRTKSNVLYS